MSETISKKDIKLWVEEAMKVSTIDCPECGAGFKEVNQYLDHRVGEFIKTQLDETQPLDIEKSILECKDGICKMISDHVEATYDIHKKGETPGVEEKEEPGLFSLEDDPEDE